VHGLLLEDDRVRRFCQHHGVVGRAGSQASGEQ
jgi:hypothetical protein